MTYEKKKKVIYMFHLGIEYFTININCFRILESVVKIMIILYNFYFN